MKNIKDFFDFIFENNDNSVKILSIILNKRNIEYKHIIYLDKGSNGVVFDLGNDKVLKITNHKEEADTASWIKENDVPNIAKIYDVFKIESSNYQFPKDLSIRFPYWAETYFLIIEKVDTSIKNKIEELFLILTNNFKINHHKNTLLSFLEKDKVNNFIRKNHPEFIKLYDDIYYLLFTLNKRYGLKYYDAHSGNIGLNKFGNLILFDVFSKSKKGYIENIIL